MTPSEREVRFGDIVFNADIYPRKAHDPELVQRYAAEMESIEARRRFMSVSEDMELLDGRHRHLAYQKNGIDADALVTVLVYPTADHNEKFLLSMDLNAEHGWQPPQAEKKSWVLKGYGTLRLPIAELAKRARVRNATANEWTKGIREEEERLQNETIFSMWLACYTQQEIGDEVGMTHQAIAQKIDVLQESFLGTKLAKLSNYGDADQTDPETDKPLWAPPLYDIWNVDRNNNSTTHFGNTPVEFVDNLLYLYTKPFDIVVDPFAGGGSTIDVCKKRSRRYWVSDRLPIVERTDIRQHELSPDNISGPARWGDVALVYLDPPYWKQAAGKYSDDPTDLANMPLDEFTATLTGIVNAYAKKLHAGAHIACIISPTQWPNEDKSTIYHDIDLAQSVKPKLVQRILCPYSTQQYNGTQVEIAKDRKLLLALTRTMLVWEVE